MVLKIVPVKATEEKAAAEREASILRKLDHRHIVRYLDSGVSDGQLWIARSLHETATSFSSSTT